MCLLDSNLWMRGEDTRDEDESLLSLAWLDSWTATGAACVTEGET